MLIREAYNMMQAFLYGYYPRFVTENTLGNRLPVFYFHEIDRGLFQAQLEYLKTNGYNTLNIKGLLDLSKRGEAPSGKDVVLTFDDGYADLFHVAYPLLKSYGFKAVSFIAPYWIGKTGYINWDKAREMHEAGIVDFQSHSYSHAMIPVSDKVKDFFHPAMLQTSPKEWPTLECGSGIPIQKTPELGCPIYEHRSGLTDSLLFLGNTALEELCIRHVKQFQTGPEEFFHQKNWRRSLFKLAAEEKRRIGRASKYESEQAQIQRFDFELSRSKEAIEDQLQGHVVTAFAFPRHAQGRIIYERLNRSGYQLIFGGLKPPIRITSPSRSRFYRRVSGDFLFRLPGKRRRTLVRIFLDKYKARRTMI